MLEEWVRRAGLSISAVKMSELESSLRVDSEYYSPKYLTQDDKLDNLHPKTLVEIARVFDGNHMTIKDEFSDEGIRYLRGQDLGDFYISDANPVCIPRELYDTMPRCHMKRDDVLISVVGTIGSVSIVTDKYDLLTGSCKIAILRSRSVNPYFLAAYLMSDIGQGQIQRRVRGAVQQGLILPDLKLIPVPTVSDDYAEKIEKLIKQSLQKNRDSVSLYAEAERLLSAELGLDRLDLSESLFNVRRVSEVQESHRADAEYYKRKYHNLLQYFDERPHDTLEQIATFSGGATPLGADYLDSGIPFLRIQNVGENRLVMDDVVFIDEETHHGLLKRSQLAPRDVLITITGRIGTSAVVPDDLKSANTNQHIVRLRLKTKNINPYYLAAFLNSVGGKLQTEREAYGTTRDALPYYCLAKIRILKANDGLQKEIERMVIKAAETNKAAKRLLAEAKAEVERLIEGPQKIV